MLIIFSISEAALALPEMITWKNYPTVVYDNRKKAVLKKNSALKLPFSVSTSKNDWFEFRINSFDRITVYPDSRLQILEFANEGDFVPDLYFLGGKIRFNSSFRSVAKNEQSVVLKTPFFELKLLEPADFVVELNMQKPSVEIKMIKGKLPVEFFAYEKKLVLAAGESVLFTGEHNPEKAGIKYDYLLNDRKVPKGILSEVQSFDQSLFLKQESEAELKEIQAKKAAEKAKRAEQRRLKAIEDSYLCKKPFGQKDQCAWFMEGLRCFRTRCNVNGQWGDRTERPVEKICKRQYFVSECDY